MNAHLCSVEAIYKLKLKNKFSYMNLPRANFLFFNLNLYLNFLRLFSSFFKCFEQTCDSTAT